MDKTRPGHVSRARLLEEGSAFARQLARAQEQQQRQQAVHQEVGKDDDEGSEQEAPQLTWNELWDAR